jgi:hypothetical protein
MRVLFLRPGAENVARLREHETVCGVMRGVSSGVVA